MKKAIILKDKKENNVFRVESIVDDGACEVATYALERATQFATCDWYDEWEDESGEALAQLLTQYHTELKNG